VAFILLITFIICIAAPALSQHNETIEDPPASRNDGPHVIWTAQDEAIVLWCCDGERTKKEYQDIEHLRLPTPCPDSKLHVTINSKPPEPPPSSYTNVPKIFVLGDVHGQHNPAYNLLQTANVIDEQGTWSFADGHLVFCGDVFDRGNDVTEILWLIYRLQKEAKKAGGATHLVLGNHEIMVLQNDLRYVTDECLEIANILGIKYNDLYGPDMELGRWLRSQNAIVRINDTVFTHGGISPTLTQTAIQNHESFDGINILVRRYIDARSYTRRYQDTPALLFGRHGTFWYRGLVRNENKYNPATTEEIQQSLDWLGANRIVVGHCEQNEIVSLHNGKVIATNIAMKDNPQALLVENNTLTRIHPDGSQTPVPAGE